MTSSPQWLIRRRGQRNDFWNNKLGWSARDEADVFTNAERNTLELPFDGYWSPVKGAK